MQKKASVNDVNRFYAGLKEELLSLIFAVPERIPNLANASAFLMEALNDVNWVGFYLFDGEKLVLGPFQGKPAAVHIPFGEGACGIAAKRGETLYIPNVHEFEGHIVCDDASKSEIVIPIRSGGKVLGVLDIDSPLYARFGEEDQKGLESLVTVLEKVFER